MNLSLSATGGRSGSCWSWRELAAALPVVSTAVIALAFGSLRAVLQQAIARWPYGDRGRAGLDHPGHVRGADPLGALRQATDIWRTGCAAQAGQLAGRAAPSPRAHSSYCVARLIPKADAACHMLA